MKRAPKFPMQYEYHDGSLDAVELGPQHEVTLHIGLDPVWNNGDTLVRRVRFSAIKNYEEVATFFRPYASTTTTSGSLDTILGISKPGKELVGIEMARLGYIELRGTKVREL